MREVVLAGAPGGGKTTLCAALGTLLRAQRWGRHLLLVDTPGLGAEPAPDPVVRRAQVQALRRLLAAPVLLHVIDASRAGAAGTLAPVDGELALLGAGPVAYAVVATHMDRPWAATGLTLIRQRLAPPRLMPVVATGAQGLGAVGQFLRTRA